MEVQQLGSEALERLMEVRRCQDVVSQVEDQ
jgi:hypothetical protein